MNKLKTIAVLTMSMAALSTAFAAEQAVTESAQAAPVVQPQAGNAELDRIVAVVNNDVITDRELQERTHVVAINLRRQNIQRLRRYPEFRQSLPADGAAPRPGA